VRVLSLGAGIQSTTLLLMALDGVIEPLDAAVFADTGWEPAPVYAHLAWLEDRCAAAGLPLHRVTAGNLRSDLLAGTAPGKSRPALPFYIRRPDGGSGMLRRQCTRHYKIDPVRAWVRQHRAGRPVQLVMGISLDEAVRMRDSGVRYITNVYPLVDRGMTRHDCTLWLDRNGYSVPPKSACIGCPYRDRDGWRDINSDPVAWADAIEVDAAIRQLPRVVGATYLHRQLVPLPVVDLSTPADHGQMTWMDECEGMCGV
jgi:hypothetical protein